MFCSNCGSEVTGKFCINCGASAGESFERHQPSETPNINQSFIQEVNGLPVDLHAIIRMYGKNKLGAAGKLSQVSGISIGKAKAILEPVYAQLGDQLQIKFGDRLKAQMGMAASEETAKRELKARYDREGTAYCPKCLSTSLSANKKGFGIGKAVIGATLMGNGLGLVAGNLGAKKVRVTCLKCGYQFMAGSK